VKKTEKVQYTLHRKKNRRHIALKVDDDGLVKVYAPVYTPIGAVEEVITTHLEWIKEKVKEVNSLPPPREAHTYEDGDIFLLLGKELTLRVETIASGASVCFRDQDSLIVKRNVQGSKRTIKSSLESYYRSYGMELYSSLVERWVDEIAEKPTRPLKGVRIAAFPKRWGSCTQEGELSFALRSLMLPLRLIDYLALHETIHLYEFNHSRRFTALLDLYMEDWRRRQREMSLLRRQVATL